MTDIINTEHVMETSRKHLLNSINRSQLHISNLLAKTDDKEGWEILHRYFHELEYQIDNATETYLADHLDEV